MFDIGFPELILIAIVGLLVIGPERLPEALRTLGLWIGRMRRSFTNVKTEIEKEIGMDEIRRQLHNEAVMEEMKRIERDVRDSVRAGESSAGKKPRHTPAQEDDEPPALESQTGSRPIPAAGASDSQRAPEVPDNPDATAHRDAADSGNADRTGEQASTQGSRAADDARHG